MFSLSFRYNCCLSTTINISKDHSIFNNEAERFVGDGGRDHPICHVKNQEAGLYNLPPMFSFLIF